MVANLNTLYAYDTIQPYNDTRQDKERLSFFDNDVEYFCESFEIAKAVLDKCLYIDPDLLGDNFLGTSLFFNNIDGFQSNFNKFRNKMLNF